MTSTNSLSWISALVCLLFALSAQGYLYPPHDVLAYSGGVNDTGTCGERICLNETASCNETTNKCQCDSGDGDGSLYCFDSDYYVCIILNDPVVTSLIGEKFNVPSPCRVNLMLYEAFKPSKATWKTTYGGRKCHVEVHSFGERVMGKVFVGGFGVHIRIKKHPHIRRVKKLNFRGFGRVDFVTNEYQFNAAVKNKTGYWVNALTDSMEVAIPYELRVNENDNKLIEFSVKKCGLYVKFRPVHPLEGAHQARVPGLAIGVDGDSPLVGELNWPQHCEFTMCNSPMGEPLENYRTSYGLSTLEKAALRTNFLFMHQMPLNILPEICEWTETMMKGCEQNIPNVSVQMVERCSYLLSHEHLVKCLSTDPDDPTPNGEVMMSWFFGCAKAVCNADQIECQNVYDFVEDKCSEHIDDWSVNSTYCSSLTYHFTPSW